MNVIQTADGSPTLFSERYNESFHSTFGAATESRYVFLETSGVTERLAAGLPTRVLEIGFGLGLNALLSCDAAIASNTALIYHAFEHDYAVCELTQRVDFAQLLENPALAGVLQTHLLAAVGAGKELSVATSSENQPVMLRSSDSSDSARTSSTSSTLAKLDLRPLPSTLNSNGFSNIPNTSTVVEFASNCTLNLHWGDASSEQLPSGHFDAIYLDAFSPDNNPECWTLEFFQRLKPLMAPHAKMSTYCAKGSVRRALIAAGFLVNKLPGPPGKREIMVASLKPDALQ